MTTTSTLVSSLNPSAWTDSVMFTATVVSDDLINFPGPPTGTVSFYDGATLLRTQALDGSGNCSFSTSALDVPGSPHDINATYNGDGTFDPSNSNHVAQVVAKAQPTVGLTLIPPPATNVKFGDPLEIRADMNIGPPNTPTEFMSWYVDNVLNYSTGSGISSASELFLNPLSVSPGPTDPVSVGNHTVRADYLGDDNLLVAQGFIGITIDPNTATTISSSLNPAVAGEVEDIVFTVTVTNTSYFQNIPGNSTDPLGHPMFNGGFTPTGTFDLLIDGIVVQTIEAVYLGGTNGKTAGATFLVPMTTAGTFSVVVEFHPDATTHNQWASEVDGILFSPSSAELIQVLTGASGGDTNPISPVEPTVPEFSTPAPPGEVESGAPAPIIRLCEQKINCDCLDSPVLNLSSERIDYPGFFCLHFGEQIPTLGTQFGEVSCVSIGNSRVGQDEACLEAAVNSIYCTTTTWTPSTVPPPPLPPPVDPPPGTFGNTEQTAFVTCPSGLVVSYTVPANTFIANTEADANLMALEFAEAYADLLALATPGCGGTTTPPTIPPPIIYLNHQATCAATCPDGLPFTFTVRAGVFAALNQALADRMAYSYACRQAQLQKLCLSSLSQSACCLGSATNITITATGSSLNNFTNLWSITSGGLPPGLSFNPTGFGGRTATISGTPTVSGSYSFTVRVSSTGGDFMEKTYILCVVELLPGTLPDASPGTPYSQLMSTSCGTPANWLVVAGSLPPGMTLGNGFGILDGTPTTAGIYSFTIQVDVT